MGNNNIINPNKEEKKIDIKNTIEDDKKVLRWKQEAIYLLILSLIVTGFIFVCYFEEYSFIASKIKWNAFKNSDWAKWGGSLIAFIWNAFVLKIVYDRWLDPSKEKALRDGLRK